MEIKDSGQRTEFETGAVRDITEGKGRFDLMPLTEITAIHNDAVLELLGEFQNTIDLGTRKCLIEAAIEVFIDTYAPSWATALLNLAKHYELGAKKYGENNWQKGIPISSFFNSAIRHYLKFKAGEKDEDHAAAFLWNLYSLLWTLNNKPEMMDTGGVEK